MFVGGCRYGRVSCRTAPEGVILEIGRSGDRLATKREKKKKKEEKRERKKKDKEREKDK